MILYPPVFLEKPDPVNKTASNPGWHPHKIRIWAVSIVLCAVCSAYFLLSGPIRPPPWQFLTKTKKLNVILTKKREEKNPNGQHNLMRQSVKGTKWITKCRVGLWVGGGWSQWYFSIPRWLACWQEGRKNCGVRDSEGGAVRREWGNCARN